MPLNPTARGRLLAAVIAITGAAGLSLGTAGAAAAKASPACNPPVLSQPFLSWGDAHDYALAPGESQDEFTGTGWALMGGAHITTTTLPNGTVHHVLDLPPMSMATSAAVCVASNYPMARTMVRSVSGAPKLSFRITYNTLRSAASPIPSTSPSWKPSPPLRLYPSRKPGWQLAVLTFIAGPGTGEAQLYNLYVDPYSK